MATLFVTDILLPDNTSSRQTELSPARLGWREFFAEQAAAFPDLLPARVIRPDAGRYHLLSERGELTGILPGKTRLDASSRADLPTVGD
ncbi:MAG: hypothetical protein KDI36_16390, partial [Pseudomonadales bacterium]|nr:hypothetical protein [Pseudomonadales bacterium]